MNQDLERALSELRAGNLVVVPTDTVYGVAALPEVQGAIDALFRAKGRPAEKAIPILGSDFGSLRAVARFDDRALALAEKFWPGALTLVLPRAEGFDHDLGGTDESTVAVRVPDSSLTRRLLGLAGPLAVTSANLSGDAPARTIEEARIALQGSVTVYLDEGPCRGDPSTVVSLLAEPEVLRSGGLAPDEIFAVL